MPLTTARARVPWRVRRHNENPRLAAVTLLSSCSASERRVVEQLATLLSMREGAVLAREGQRGRDFMIVLEGEASVHRRDHEVGTLMRGDFLGELATVGGSRRAVTVIAKTPMLLEVIDQRDFSSLLRRDPDLARRLVDGVARRLAEANGANGRIGSVRPAKADELRSIRPSTGSAWHPAGSGGDMSAPWPRSCGGSE